MTIPNRSGALNQFAISPDGRVRWARPKLTYHDGIKLMPSTGPPNPLSEPFFTSSLTDNKMFEVKCEM